jgi:nucleoside-diphosphate-sugar epimerase
MGVRQGAVEELVRGYSGMRVLITGNMGYVGPAVVRHMRSEEPAIELIGYDAGFFGSALTAADALPQTLLDRQYFGDIRDFPSSLLEGTDAVVHLAAISNDPMGSEFEAVTRAVNQDATVRIAGTAATAGVKSFVFASSCSVYGAANGGARREIDPVNPLTAYARSKIGAEQELASANFPGMAVTSLRFATACGMSDRLRLDLVLNDFVACALTSSEITVQSDGTPWRPLIDVDDMARAILWAIRRDSGYGGAFLAVNAGRDKGNYQVADLAAAVAKAVPGTRVSINAEAPPDRRSYKVDFGLFKKLAPSSVPTVTLEQSIGRLVEGLRRMNFADRSFRASPYMRLNMLRGHIAAGRLSRDLRWVRP